MLTLAMFALLQGCPDPTTAAELGNPGPGGANPQSGPPGEPPSPDGAGGAPGSGPPPSVGGFDVKAGEGVTVAGSLQYAGDKKGTIRIDFLAKEGEAPPQLAHVLELDAVGPFSVEAPKGIGALHLVAFIDVDSDGPSSSDPAGKTTSAINVDEDAIADITIVLSDEPDLGDFTPGNEAPPAGSLGAPPMEAAEEAPTEAPEADAPPAEAVEETPKPKPGGTDTASSE